MTRAEYLKARNELITTAQNHLNDNKNDLATETMDKVKKLDTDFEEQANIQTNLDALNKIQMPVPNIVNAEPINFVEPIALDPKDKQEDLYLNAWAKDLLQQNKTKEESEIFDKVINAAQKTGENQVVIPKTVSKGIWKEIGNLYPLFGDVVSTNIIGDISLIKEETDTDMAEWVDEDTEGKDGTVKFGTVELTGCELLKSIPVSWKLRKMSIEEFIPYITTLLAEKMGMALAHAIVHGKGKPTNSDDFKAQPRGIKTALESQDGTPQIITYTKLDYTTMTLAMSKVKKYSNGASIYANNTTIWMGLANILDATDKPLFIPDPTGEGVGRIFGKIVKLDDSMLDDEIVLGNVAKGYTMNKNLDVALYTEEHIKKRYTDYMTYAIVDGDVMTENAFVYMNKAASKTKQEKEN